MSNNEVVLLDAMFMAHRAWHSMDKKLSHDNVPTAVTYGFLRDVCSVIEHNRYADLIFCWDHGVSKRREVYSLYKAKRQQGSVMMEYEKQDKEKFLEQVVKLKTDILTRLGFSNNFYHLGYEADDLIAELVYQNFGDEIPIKIISADKDLFQLIRPNVLCHNPITRKDTTLQSFTREYGIPPSKWYQVKAIAGCRSDGVPGAPKVGDSTAIKFLKNELAETTKTYQACKLHCTSEENGGNGLYRRNVKLVKLPYEGTPALTVRDDTFSKAKWKAICEEFGIQSLPYPFRESQ